MLLGFRLLHMIGFMLWMGGAITVAFTAAAPSETPRAARGTLRRASLALVTPGMLLSFIGGLGMLLPRFTDVYARAAWMHGKLTLLLVLAAMTGILGGKLRKSTDGSADVPNSTFRKLGIAMLLLSTVVIGLAVLKPGA